jgi:hypothetical protein
MLLGTRVGDRRAQTLLRKEFRMQRRTLISTLALAGLKAREAGAVPAAQDAIPKRVFGKTGESLTIIGMAGGRLPLANDKDDARAIVRRAYELGINYFDNARVYWNGQSEEIYGDVLPRWRKQVFLTTKSVARDRKGAEADLERSLKALVFGGGVAGLSAAHELAERGFQVHVYERKPVQHMFVCGEGESSGSF